MQRIKVLRMPATMVALALLTHCAAPGPTARSPFVLVEGKRIGKLELAVEEESGWTQKSKDSVKFDNQYLHARPRIGFRYPGEEIVMMKIFDGDQLVKSCDEGSFTRSTSPQWGGGGAWMVGPNGEMIHTTAPVLLEAKEEYKVKYNLECEVAALKDGMTVALYDGVGLVSKYRVAATGK